MATTGSKTGTTSYAPHVSGALVTIGAAIFGFGFAEGGAVRIISDLVGSILLGLGVFTDAKVKDSAVTEAEEKVSEINDLVSKHVATVEKVIEDGIEKIAGKN